MTHSCIFTAYSACQLWSPRERIYYLFVFLPRLLSIFRIWNFWCCLHSDSLSVICFLLDYTAEHFTMNSTKAVVVHWTMNIQHETNVECSFFCEISFMIQIIFKSKITFETLWLNNVYTSSSFGSPTKIISWWHMATNIQYLLCLPTPEMISVLYHKTGIDIQKYYKYSSPCH